MPSFVHRMECKAVPFSSNSPPVWPRTIIVKNEKGDLVADSHSIMTRWRNYFSHLLNVHGAKEVRQAEIRTAEPLVPEPSAFEVELAVGY